MLYVVFLYLFKQDFSFKLFIWEVFWSYCLVCGLLAPWPGIKPVTPALEAQSFNHWTSKEVPIHFKCMQLYINHSSIKVLFVLLKWMILARTLPYTKTNIGLWTQTGIRASDRSWTEHASCWVTILNDSWPQPLMQEGRGEWWGGANRRAPRVSERAVTAQSGHLLSSGDPPFHKKLKFWFSC